MLIESAGESVEITETAETELLRDKCVSRY
jgi:hypothetical protein